MEGFRFLINLFQCKGRKLNMIRVVLAHPSSLVCDLLRKTLNNEEDVYLAGSANTIEELEFLLPHTNIVLISKEFEGGDITNILQDIREKYPEIKLLVLEVAEEPGLIIKYIEAGADGYILEDESVEKMMGKVRASDEDEALVSPAVAAVLMDRLAELANIDTPLAFMEARDNMIDKLTSREEEVLELVAEGCTNKEIAGELFIECGT
ncbi:MAG: response regulator transcription factor, partial [candidate division Zixibacteria bacterium]|nr:response regulator transcription factor [candidate division Zixibacteria bacterium]NIT52105.1 response regulator transcription factor [candidate division Zixibacteria bacterium]NIU14708.1 response regulator transcription factor [candidate division Zixibacteria bacterium]NIV06701.1 hypothetical protein [candidate division Zixibacteria bacterium]NIW41307.1 hypothetical protein [candidate division Zixibacteria bacterium]